MVKEIFTSVPAVVFDGKLADCPAGRGPDIGALKAEGLGVQSFAGIIYSKYAKTFFNRCDEKMGHLG